MCKHPPDNFALNIKKKFHLKQEIKLRHPFVKLIYTKSVKVDKCFLYVNRHYAYEWKNRVIRQKNVVDLFISSYIKQTHDIIVVQVLIIISV